MALKALWDITNQFNSKNGNILASGKIYIYYQGRTSLADTYKDEDGTVLNTNPVLLDNNGMATVFVRPIYAYTIAVCDYYGVELFSRDITIRDAITTAEDVVLIGSDGTVQIDTTQLPNGVQYDCSVNTDIIATKDSVDNNKSDIIDLTTVVNNHTSSLGEINTALLSKKDKQSPYSSSGSPTNTITDISQDENGEISVTYSDINLPAEVPNVEITSDNNSINVTESTDIETNTKTFDLQVNANTESEYGQFISTNVVDGAHLLKVKGNIEVSSGNKIKLKKGNSYHFTLHGEYIANQANTCDTINFIEYASSKVIEVNVDNTISEGQHFELSYDVYDLLADTDYYVTFSNVAGVIKELTIYVHSIGSVSIGSGGGGSSYTDGNGINITNDEISVDAGNGLGFDDDGKLEIKVGTGLTIDDNKLIVIDNDVSDVVAAVNKLQNDLDQKITTTYPFAQITNQGDYAGFGVTNTSRMIGQLFAIPISSEIRKDETVLYVNALQNYTGDVVFGIFEYDFDGNEGSGSTYWIADTGKVKINAGENKFPLLQVKNDTQELNSSKLYYAVIAIRGNAPSSGLYLASSPNYSTNYNANPRYTLLASNMDSFIDWNTGSLIGAYFQGYNEDNNIPRLFMMLRNGDEVTPPIPITEPFIDIGAFTLEHQYKISSIFSLTPTATGIVYRKVIPLKDVDITSFSYVDYRGSVRQEHNCPVLLDDTYTPKKYISDGSWTHGNGDLTKIDGEHFVHKFTFSAPVQLIAGNVYWLMVGGNLSATLGDSWMITYSSPSITNDLLLVADMYNVNSYIITNGLGEYIGGAPGMYLKLTDNNNTSWVI